MMRFARRLTAIIAALSLFLVFSPATHALTVANQFNTPIYLTINPGETKPIIFVPQSGVTVSAIVAKIEQLSSSGRVVGEYSILHAGNQYKIGNISGSSSVQIVGVSYYSPPYNGLFILRSEGTTSPISVRVTFYNGSAS